MSELRDYGDNRHNKSRRYYVYGEDGGSFRSGEIQASGYGGLSCDLNFHDVSIDKVVRILALLKEG